MSKTRSRLSIYYRAILVLIVFVVIVYLFVRNINIFGNVVLAMVGFGAVVLVHEFGHFIVAKLSNIAVEAFSIFMPPILVGMRKTAGGLRIRILPELLPKEDDEKGEGLLGFSVGKKGKGHSEAWPGETEYRLGLIPFGGYVKLLGQEDTGPVKATDDPRSFANKPVSTRVPVIAAGVLFNVISAVIIFMVVFLVGIKLPPAIVGGVVPNSPAARAGIRPGDEIVEIAGKSKDIDFSNILIAAALSDEDEEVPLTVRHEDGSEEYYTLVAEQLLGESMRDFGILQPLSLTIAEVSDANILLDRTGLRAGDRIRAVNGKKVQSYWQLQEIVERAFVPEVTILAERADETGKIQTIETKIKLALSLPKGLAKPIKRDVSKTERDLSNVYSIVPRLLITEVSEQLKAEGTEQSLKSDDIIVAVGDIENPTYKEMRTVTVEYKDKQLPLKVLRIKDGRAMPRTGSSPPSAGSEEIVTVNVVPHWSRERKEVVIGIGITLDLENAVVADTVYDEDGKKKLDIPRGALITAINGVPVSNFFEIAREIGQNIGGPIMINYRLADGTLAEATLDIETDEDFVPIKPIFAEFIPFNRLERLYQAKGPIEAIAMGYRKTIMFIVQTYVTLQRLIGGLVSPKELMGPVGIIAFSYRIVAEQPLVNYLYFLGLISACIAVINFLPMPPFDGGIIVLLLIEKIKGSALSERTQGVIAYAGWALIGGLLLYVTFNDIVRNFFS